jgi:hypothetical protein
VAYNNVYEALVDLFQQLGLADRFDGGLYEGDVPPNTALPNAYYEPTSEAVIARTNRSKFKTPLVTVYCQDKTFTKAEAHYHAIEDALKQTAGVDMATGQVLYARVGGASYVKEVGFVKAAVEIQFMTVRPL